MKRLLVILCLLVFALPSFATGDYYEGCNDNITYTPNNGVQDYYTKLEKRYREKYDKDNSYPANSYNKEVYAPLLHYMIRNSSKFPSN